jgi:hypothetical protein
MTIRLEDGHITMAGDANYEAELERLVRRALATVTGQAIATKIRAHGNVLLAQDYPGMDRGELNDETTDGRTKGLVVIGFHPYDINVGTFVFNGRPVAATWVQAFSRAPGHFPDEDLIHELVHAARILGGDQKTIKLKGTMEGWDTEEEFFAVVVTNIYSSEMNRDFRHFRKSHKLAWSPEMTAEEVEPWMFLFANDNYRLIEKFCDQHPTVAPRIASAQAEFNPIRDYYNFKRGEPPPLILKVREDVDLPIRITQHEPRVPITDSYLLTLLEPRSRGEDVAGNGESARKLESVFGQMLGREALPLLSRLVSRPPGDKVAMYFHEQLATETRQKLLKILALSTARP